MPWKRQSQVFPLQEVQGMLNSDGEPANIEAYIPKAGTYLFSVDLTTLKYSLQEVRTPAKPPEPQP